jgi:hypothetical protein
MGVRGGGGSAPMRIVPFRPGHLSALVLQPHQRAWQGKITAGHARVLGDQGQAWTALRREAVAGCAGVLDRGEGRGLAWALLAGDLGPAGFVALHRAVAAGLPSLPYRRIEAHVAADFAPGRRWATMLGFAFEGVMRGYQADGGDALMFARVRCVQQIFAAADSNAGA